MIQKMIPAAMLLFSMANLASAQGACPSCAVNLPQDLPADTLYLAPAPNGRAGEFYSADISFRVPQTTTPVASIDSTVSPGIPINKITITGLTNLPPGLNWFVPQTMFPLPDSTDGCVRICGTPLQPGTYLVNVVLTAQVFIFSQTATFNFPIVIEPAQSVTEGFTMTNASGCGEVTVAFTNNVPSGGNPGFSYFWDFGNGNFSPEENPVQQTYTVQGQYRVDYRAVVDTFGHVLTRVRVDQVSCTDIINGPDIKVLVYAPDSTVLFQSAIVQNASLPVEFLLNVPIGTGNHRLRVIDVDAGPLGGADDECGTITFNRTLSGDLNAGSLRAFLEIIHPTDTIRSSDTITVYPRPAAPLIMGIPNGTLCEGEMLTLAVNYTENLQWYRDSLPIIPGDEAVIDIELSGLYHVDYTASNGCRVSSAPALIYFAPLPAVPVYVSNQNRLTLFDPSALPVAARLQWFVNGEAIADANGWTYCIPASGIYTLEVTDLITGCSNSFSLPITFNPNFPNCVSNSDENTWAGGAINVSPNPSPGDVEVFMRMHTRQDIGWQLMDMQGRILSRGMWNAPIGQSRYSLAMAHLPAGLYGLGLRSETAFTMIKIVKQ